MSKSDLYDFLNDKFYNKNFHHIKNIMILCERVNDYSAFRSKEIEILLSKYTHHMIENGVEIKNLYNVESYLINKNIQSYMVMIGDIITKYMINDLSKIICEYIFKI